MRPHRELVEREADAVFREAVLEPARLVVAGQTGGRVDPVDLDVRRPAAERRQRVVIGVVRQRADEHPQRHLERLRRVDARSDSS